MSPSRRTTGCSTSSPALTQAVTVLASTPQWWHCVASCPRTMYTTRQMWTARNRTRRPRLPPATGRTQLIKALAGRWKELRSCAPCVLCVVARPLRAAASAAKLTTAPGPIRFLTGRPVIGTSVTTTQSTQ